MAPDAFAELFAPIDPGDDDGPELHVIGLAGHDLDAWFALLRESGADFGDSLVWLEDEQRDAPVADVPDVARAIIERGASATPFVEGVHVEGTVLPRFSFFALSEEIQLFWYPSEGRWDDGAIEAFVVLLRRFRDRAPQVRLVPDPRYVEPFRADIAAALGRRFGPDAVALG